MLKNPFFKNKGPISLKFIYSICNVKKNLKDEKIKISDVKNLNECSNNDITFFHSAKYKGDAIKTKA